MRYVLTLLVLVAAVSGCAINAATGAGMYVSKELATSCVKDCETLGMKLSAVVIVANMGGCVCEPSAASPNVTSAGSAVAGGAAIRVAQEAAAQEQQRQWRGSTAPAK